MLKLLLPVFIWFIRMCIAIGPGRWKSFSCSGIIFEWQIRQGFLRPWHPCSACPLPQRQVDFLGIIIDGWVRAQTACLRPSLKPYSLISSNYSIPFSSQLWKKASNRVLKGAESLLIKSLHYHLDFRPFWLSFSSPKALGGVPPCLGGPVSKQISPGPSSETPHALRLRHHSG